LKYKNIIIYLTHSWKLLIINKRWLAQVTATTTIRQLKQAAIIFHHCLSTQMYYSFS